MYYICWSQKSVSNTSLFNRYIPILNRVAKSSKDILRYHKISFDTLNTLVTSKYRFLKMFFSHEFYHAFHSFKFFLQHETHLSRATIIFQYSRRTVNLFMLKFKSGQTLFEEKLTFDLLSLCQVILNSLSTHFEVKSLNKHYFDQLPWPLCLAIPFEVSKWVLCMYSVSSRLTFVPSTNNNNIKTF